MQVLFTHPFLASSQSWWISDFWMAVFPLLGYWWICRRCHCWFSCLVVHVQSEWPSNELLPSGKFWKKKCIFYI